MGTEASFSLQSENGWLPQLNSHHQDFANKELKVTPVAPHWDPGWLSKPPSQKATQTSS